MLCNSLNCKYPAFYPSPAENQHMKKVFLFLALSLLTLSAAFSQSNKKLVVQVARPHWCPPCRAKEGKIIPAYSSSNDVAVVINGITNNKTKTKSNPGLQLAGVYEIAQKKLATGSIALINSVTGKIINRLHVA